jgi:hypothetical protein
MKLEDILKKTLNDAAKQGESGGCDGNCEGCQKEESISADLAFSVDLDEANANADSSIGMVHALSYTLMCIAKHHGMPATAQSAFDIWMKCRRD